MSNRVFQKLKTKFKTKVPEEMSLQQYIERVKDDPSLYASPAERLLKAIGEPEIIDTSKDDRSSRIHRNIMLKYYPTFHDFYGMEDVVSRVVNFFKYAGQGLEESKQILYLLGPVGSAKSSLAERLKELMSEEPIYALKGSPIQESPLGLFEVGDAEALGIPDRYLRFRASPWAIKRLDEFKGDITKFRVVKLYPDESHQLAITKTEPGDENNQDISTLVGKVDIRKLEFLSQDDPDAYSYSGSLCQANQGLMDFVEMFKAPPPLLHPLLTATQEGNYKGTEAIPAIPFDGLVVAHSNESDWLTFCANNHNEAILDRISVVKVPYCLRVDEEIQIYEKYLRKSSLKNAPKAPGTFKMLAQFSVLTRLEEPENSSVFSKMKVYNGQNVKDKDPKARSLQEYKESASHGEGFSGFSTRDAFKILSTVYNFDLEELAANPVHMLFVLRQFIEESDEPDEAKVSALEIVEDYLTPQYADKVEKDIQTAFLDNYEGFGQSIFDKYILFSDHWLQDKDHRDPDTGQMYNKEVLNAELEKIEKPADIGDVKAFRNEIVHYALRYQGKHNGNNPPWTSYQKIRDVIERNMFDKTEDMLPIISFAGHGDKEHENKHHEFIDRMIEKGYTPRQVQLVVEWQARHSKSK